MKLGVQVGVGPGHIVVRWGPSSCPQKVGAPPNFPPVCYGQTAAWIKMPLGTEVGPGSDDFVLDGDLAPLPKKAAQPPPKFSAHAHCGQTAEWIKMALGLEVGLGPGHIALDGDPAPSQKGGKAPNFRPVSIVAKRLHEPRCHLVQR